MTSPSHIFICHAREDRVAAKELCEALEEAGHPCWLAARDAAAGGSKSRAITAALAASRAMLVVVSSNTARTKKVLQEIERGAKRGLALIPVRVEQVEPQGELARLLGSAEILDAPIGPTPPLVRQIAAAAAPAAEPEPIPEEPEEQPEPEPVPIPVPAPRPRPRPVPLVQPAPPPQPAKKRSTWMIAGLAGAIALFAVTCNIYMGRNSLATAVRVAPGIDTTAFEADAATIGAAIPELQARAVRNPTPRAVRSALIAYGATPPDSVRSVGFVDDGVQWTIHLIPEARYLIFTAAGSTTEVFVADIIYPANTLEVQTALAGTPPGAMRTMDDARAALVYGPMLARWAAYIRDQGMVTR